MIGRCNVREDVNKGVWPSRAIGTGRATIGVVGERLGVVATPNKRVVLVDDDDAAVIGYRSDDGDMSQAVGCFLAPPSDRTSRRYLVDGVGAVVLDGALLPVHRVAVSVGLDVAPGKPVRSLGDIQLLVDLPGGVVGAVAVGKVQRRHRVSSGVGPGVGGGVGSWAVLICPGIIVTWRESRRPSCCRAPWHAHRLDRGS